MGWKFTRKGTVIQSIIKAVLKTDIYVNNMGNTRAFSLLPIQHHIIIAQSEYNIHKMNAQMTVSVCPYDSTQELLDGFGSDLVWTLFHQSPM
jgi:hypothetical protein